MQNFAKAMKWLVENGKNIMDVLNIIAKFLYKLRRHASTIKKILIKNLPMIASVWVSINRIIAEMKTKKSEKKAKNTDTSKEEEFIKNATGVSDKTMKKVKREASKYATNKKVNDKGFAYSDLEKYTEGGLKFMKRVSNSRNEYFQSLPVEDQIRVLESEGFSVRSFMINEARRINGTIKKYGEITPDMMTKVNWDSPDGLWSTPMERFKKNPIKTIKRWLGISVESLKTSETYQWLPFDEAWSPDDTLEPSQVANLHVLLADKGLLRKSDIGKVVKKRTHPYGMSKREHEIRQEEMLRHKSYSKYQKAVRSRMMDEGIQPSLLELLSEEKKISREKKKQRKYTREDDYLINQIQNPRYMSSRDYEYEIDNLTYGLTGNPFRKYGSKMSAEEKYWNAVAAKESQMIYEDLQYGFGDSLRCWATRMNGGGVDSRPLTDEELEIKHEMERKARRKAIRKAQKKERKAERKASEFLYEEDDIENLKFYKYK